jgi:hypothetical protein
VDLLLAGRRFDQAAKKIGSDLWPALFHSIGPTHDLAHFWARKSVNSED